MKTKEQVSEQSQRINAALWAMDCRVSGNVHKRNVRLIMVAQFAAMRIYKSDFFKSNDVTFGSIARYAEKSVTDRE